MKVRDGLSTSFWHDIWTDMGCLSDLIGAGGFIEMGIRSTATVASAVARRKKHTGWIFITWLKQSWIIKDLKCPIHMISLYGSKRKTHIGPNLVLKELGFLLGMSIQLCFGIRGSGFRTQLQSTLSVPD
ncbi:unnamed protein product [Brassica rapa subsp. trilocularis]